MNRIMTKLDAVMRPALLVAALLAAAGAQETEGAEARTRARRSLRPQWTPGRTIDASSWNYDGPVSAVYTRENAPTTPKLEDLPTKESVSQHGITWTFEKPVPAGRFITGDWYVAGPVTVAKITPQPLFGEAVEDHSQWELINERAVKEREDYKGKWTQRQDRTGSFMQEMWDKYRRNPPPLKAETP